MKRYGKKERELRAEVEVFGSVFFPHAPNGIKYVQLNSSTHIIYTYKNGMERGLFYFLGTNEKNPSFALPIKPNQSLTLRLS
jgi:hypothetical protein